jgi:hypothetical protein
MIPKFKNTFSGWEQPIQLVKITQTINDFEVKNQEEVLHFKGVVQNLNKNELMIKPISERSWEWLQIHTKNSLAITTGDKIIYNEKKFKVMFESDYSIYGYKEYHLIKDYE